MKNSWCATVARLCAIGAAWYVAGWLTPPVLADDGATDPVLARGRELFLNQCVICHGDLGDGQGKYAYLMNPRPRNFKKGQFKLTTTQNQIPTDEDLLRTLRRGMPGSAMPPWDHLPLADLRALVRYVRSIHEGEVKRVMAEEAAAGQISEQQAAETVAQRTKPGPPLVIPPEPGFDNLHWFNGRRLYLEACASCHGVSGEPVAEAVKLDGEGYPTPPRSFVKGIFKGGNDGHQLYARIFKGMAGTPMPAYEGNYQADDFWDIIHYIQSLARAGSQERAELRSEAIVAAKVDDDALPKGPSDPAWDQARPVYVGLTPLWWTENRIEGLVVQALHQDSELALRLSWVDPTIDDRAVRVDEFRDAVAIQFSLTSKPPFYMGSPGKGGVNMWLWKADRQHDIAEGYQDVDAAFPNRAADMYPEQNYVTAGDPIGAPWPRGKITDHRPAYITAWGAGNLVADPELKTPVESLTAHGPGSLEGKPIGLQRVAGQAVHDRGIWRVQMQRALTLPGENGESDERTFSAGDYIPVSFAIWNGDAGDRDGKKNISIWQRLVIE